MSGVRGLSIEDRFWSKVSVTGSCWLWMAGTYRNGYGAFWIADTRMERAHRWAYESLVAPIPAGMVIDHICRVRNCVNPDHLQVVTMTENTLRGQAASAINARKVLCKRGHPLAGENLIRARSGQRICRTCNTDRQRQAAARRRLNALAEKLEAAS